MPYKIKEEFINSNKLCKLTTCVFYMADSTIILKGNTNYFVCTSPIQESHYCYVANRLCRYLSYPSLFNEYITATSVFDITPKNKK